MENSPNGLQPPVAPMRRLSKRPMYIFIVAVFILLAALYYAIDYNERRHQRKSEEDNAIVSTKEPPLARLDSAALALPEPKDEESPPAIITPKKKEIAPRKPIVINFTKKTDDGDKEEQKRKRQLALNALTAPLVKSTQGGGNRKHLASMERSEGEPANRQGRQSGDDARRRAAEHTAPNVNRSYDPAADIDKENFLKRADQGQWISPYTRESGRKYELKTGTVIPGVMITGINSDLPGVMIAQITQTVYDTATGNYLLLPQGAKLYGVYDSRVVYGQERVLVAWNRIIFPDGTSVTLGAMPGTDMSGYSGFNDKVNNHYFRIFGGAFLMSAIIGSTAYAIDSIDSNSGGVNSKDNPSLGDELGSALATQMSQTSLKLLERNLNIKPTLEIRPGYQFNIVVTKDLVFNGGYKPISY